MKHIDFSRHKSSLLSMVFLLLCAVAPARAQYYYAQWTANLSVGDNTFNITSGTTSTNWTTGIQAVTPELLANSVTVNSGVTNVSVTVKKATATTFIVNTTTAISGAVITAQYPGVVCAPPTLISVTRSGTTATFTWDNNGTPYYTINLQYSTDGGVTWIGSAGGPTSPRNFSSVPTTSPILFRVVGYGPNCSEQISNVISVGCTPPTLTSVNRSGSSATYYWTNNGSPFTTVSLEYSTNGGTTWITNAGSPTAPRTIPVSTASPILYRVVGYGGGCTGQYSNIINQ